MSFAFIMNMNDRYLKNSVSKSIIHVIKQVNFPLYRAQANAIIWKKTDKRRQIYKQRTLTFCTSNDVSKRC